MILQGWLTHALTLLLPEFKLPTPPWVALPPPSPPHDALPRLLLPCAAHKRQLSAFLFLHVAPTEALSPSSPSYAAVDDDFIGLPRTSHAGCVPGGPPAHATHGSGLPLARPYVSSARRPPHLKHGLWTLGQGYSFFNSSFFFLLTVKSASSLHKNRGLSSFFSCLASFLSFLLGVGGGEDLVKRRNERNVKF